MSVKGQRSKATQACRLRSAWTDHREGRFRWTEPMSERNLFFLSLSRSFLHAVQEVMKHCLA